jgi:hypothetical protein
MDAYKNMDVVLVMWWDGCYTQNVTPGGITSGGHHLRGASPPGNGRLFGFKYKGSRSAFPPKALCGWSKPTRLFSGGAVKNGEVAGTGVSTPPSYSHL